MREDNYGHAPDISGLNSPMSQFPHSCPALKIFYFDTNCDDLLVDGVGPVCRDWEAAGGTDVFLERDWRGGPHIKMVFAGADLERSLAARSESAPRLEAYLREHPSTRHLTEEESRRTHDLMTAAEGDIDVYRPLSPNNTILFSDYPLVGRLSPSRESAELCRRFSVWSNRLLLKLFAMSRNLPGERLRLVALILFEYAHSLIGLQRGYFFMRVYFEKMFAVQFNGLQAVRDRFEDKYAANRDTLCAWVQRFLGRRDRQADQDSSLLDLWREVLHRIRADVADAIRADHKVTWTLEEARQLIERIDDARLQSTPFMERLGANALLWQRMNSDEQMRVHMFVVNRIYVLIANTGITAAQKLTLFYLLSRAIEDYFNQDPLEMIQARR